MNRRRLIITTVATVIAAVTVIIVMTIADAEHPLSANPSRQDYPVRGIDISAHNGDVDFNAVAADSIDFVFIKATEGKSFKDRNFKRNVVAARRAGLKVGAYHFFRFDAPGHMQALNMLHSVKGYDLDLPLVIDVEEFTNPDDHATELIVNRLGEMTDYLASHGYKVIIYTNKRGYNRFVSTTRFNDLPLWICTFSTPAEGLEWRFWQYSHRGKVNGIATGTDLNVFGGTRAEWERYTSSPAQ